ncbi:hypothetical protein OAJ21_02125 [Pelagibacteraceae bacterium]|nr:hypothetical protein [Pelagibacteraceae bacterium]
MKILITEFMDVKSVEMLKTNFDVIVHQVLSTNFNESNNKNTVFKALLIWS